MVSQEYIDKLAFGRNYEIICQDKIKNKNNVSIVMEQNAENYKNVNYDFMTSDLITYEVKADEMSLNTNNFFIEFKKGNMLTGILTSDATFHIITNTKKYYLIETAEIRKLVFQNRIKYKQGRTKDNTVGFLVPTCDIIELSEVI